MEEGESEDVLAVMSKLQSVLRRGVERYLTCKTVLLPRATLLKAGRDVVRLCSERPGGLRGALVDLYLTDTDHHSCMRLAQVVADPRMDPKTLIKVTLHRDPSCSDPSVLSLLSGYTMERSTCRPT
ncbi:DNA damage-inducible transcript 4 protein [Chionoecetes opilio]|uniref:DNA damage-inducible transcript 4 protein n=1 Tax=Chionoecetes opilio TaxID=41210 RepID=A0A8J8WNF3_CHIOP|nr:DNA damage-inducible transcript 4 protein [Chionoecetes opilio]